MNDSPDLLKSDGLIGIRSDPKDSDTMSVDKLNVAKCPSSALDVKGLRKTYLDQLADLEELESTFFTWNLTDYTKLEQKQYSPEFEMAGYNWRLLLFPFGCQQREFVSIFLDCPGPVGFDEAKDPQSVYKHITADFILILHNTKDPTIFEAKYAYHRFTPRQTDWGFTRFFDIRKLNQNSQGRHKAILEETSICSISVLVRHIKDSNGILWHNFEDYDSKTETGYIGLKNQGATCYMNSLLQSLYIIGSFRKLVFRIPTQNDQPTTSIAYALQRIFYNLQNEKDVIGTNELTQSFGWDVMDSFMQHDVQEFNRVLQDSLESRMRNTEVEDALTKIFVGRMKSYIKCVNVDYESSRIEDFWDIQLNVKGMKDLEESFKNYIQVETLEGDNKYFAEIYGLQDANKGVIFESFPPVLHLQLKRFEYDLERDAMVKINDRHEFSLEIDLDRFLDESSDRSESWVYCLHGVLVHSGDLHGGHYYALLKPRIDGDWLRFDDDRVTKATLKEVLDENFGGDLPNIGRPQSGQAAMRRFMNAYMLVYVRKSRRAEILADVTVEEVPEHLRRRIDIEKAEEKRLAQEMIEAYRYVPVRILTLKQFQEHHESDYSYTDFNQFAFNKDVRETYHTMRVEKNESVVDFKEKVAELLGLESYRLRIYPLIIRQNQTIRADNMLEESYDLKIDKVREMASSKSEVLRVWAEVAPEGAEENYFPSLDDENSPLIFFKYFDPTKQTLTGMFTLYVKWADKISSVLPNIREKMGWSENVPIKLYEEIKPTLIDEIRLDSTFYSTELINGDIICFQKNLSIEEAQQLTAEHLYPFANQYYDFLAHRLTITFKHYVNSIESGNEKQEEWSQTLSQKTTYNQLVSIIADRIKVNADYIRLYLSNPSTLSYGQPIKRSQFLTLGSIFYSMKNMPCVINYEILEISVTDMDRQKCLRISWLSDGICKEESSEVWVSKDSTLLDAVQVLAVKLKKPIPDLENEYRIYQAVENKYLTILKHFEVVDTLETSFNKAIYLEKIPNEELQVGKKRPIVVFHYHRDVKKTHGIPFQFMLKQDEPFSETKKRLQARMGMKDYIFNRISDFVLVPGENSSPTKIEDDVVLYSECSQDDLLGLDHVDKNRNFGPVERAISIKSW